MTRKYLNEENWFLRIGHFLVLVVAWSSEDNLSKVIWQLEVSPGRLSEQEMQRDERERESCLNIGSRRKKEKQ